MKWGKNEWITLGIIIGLVIGGLVGYWVGVLLSNMEMVSCLNSCSHKWLGSTFDNCVRNCMR